LSKRPSIKIQNASQNNLKNISLEIPHYQLIAVTGVSGSGKSSLAFDVIANEGRRQYLDTIPNFAKQFAGKYNKPEVDEISGLFPVITVGQFKGGGNSSSTVGTVSELYDLLRLIYARFGSVKGLSRAHFSFNSQFGACPHCKGIGLEERISVPKLIADPRLTLREGAMVPTLPNGYIMYSQVTVDVLDMVCKENGFNVDIPWNQLTKEQKNVVLNGSERIKVPFGKHSIESRLKWTGLKAKPREEGFYKGILPIMADILKRDRNKNILRFVESVPCSICQGDRLIAKALDSSWNNQSITSLIKQDLISLFHWLESIYSTLSKPEKEVVCLLKTHLELLIKLGLGNLTLGTSTDNLSPTQHQRIRVSNQLQTDLSNVLYVFDEPSIGMSIKEKGTLLKLLNNLVSKGNTVIIVEHDLELIKAADWIVEIGPKSGRDGGELVFNGPKKLFLKDPQTSTQLAISNHSPDLNIQFQVINGFKHKVSIEENDIFINQSPIGRTPRSNSATYTGLADLIRDHMAKQELSKERSYKKGRFSFNNKGGRCETCEGAGKTQIGMHFMGTVDLICESCLGKRFNPETLEVKSFGKSISEIYQLSVRTALEVFQEQPKMLLILIQLNNLGLGYLQLGQSSTTLSGGEAQRIKLASLLAKKGKRKFVLEEPTNGLHHQDVLNLIDTLNKLIYDGNEVVCYTTHPLLLGHEEIKPVNRTVMKPVQTIQVENARTNNLKGIDVRFQKDSITVVTGRSGSGKSSLVFETVFAEAQARFTSSLSNYAKSFIKQANPAKADRFIGLTPTVAINRKNLPSSPRSTVGTLTGINEKLRYLYSRHADVSANSLSFNSEHGMCLTCSGIGELPKAQRILLAPDWSLSINEGAFTSNTPIKYYGNPVGQFVAILAEATNSQLLSTPLNQLSTAELDVIYDGTGDKVWETTWYFKNKSRQGQQEVKGPWKGFSNFINDEYEKVKVNKSIRAIESLMLPEKCSNCEGHRLNEVGLTIQLAGENLFEAGERPISELHEWLKSTAFPIPEVGAFILDQISPLIESMQNLGLGHLSVNRRSSTLSGGEGQRLRIAQLLTNGLTGLTYILDEPTIGLHNENVKDLWKAIQSLKEKGNTVIIVEHHPYIIDKADYRIEVGPGSGENGGQLIYENNLPITKKEFTLDKAISKGKIELKGVTKFSLFNRDFEFELGQLNVVTGLSGSGKSTLMNHVLIPSLRYNQARNCISFNSSKANPNIIQLDQKALNGSRASTISSYLKLTDLFAKSYASQQGAKQAGLKMTSFLYSHKDGKCLECNGQGRIKHDLDFVGEVWNTCAKCFGNRFNTSSAEIKLGGLNISELYQLNVDQIIEHFNNRSLSLTTTRIIEILTPLNDLGLGHLKISQTTSKLSGGEAQRLKMASELKLLHPESIIVLDEPTSGLNEQDVLKLLEVFQILLNQGHSLICVEHDEQVISVAQHLIEV
jgi:excinuclease ABC subunit A